MMASEPYAVYENLFDAPEPFRELEGAKLTLEQLNFISKRAYDLGFDTDIPARSYSVIETDAQGNENVVNKTTPKGKAHTDSRNAAIDEFKKLHEIVGNQWIRTGGN
jgi:hypothetical protein